VLNLSLAKKGKNMAISEKSKNANKWQISLTVLCLVIVAYGFFFLKIDKIDVENQLVSFIVMSLFIWVVLYLVMLKNMGKDIMFIAFMAIFLSVVASNYAGYYRQKHLVKEALTDIQHFNFDLINKPGENNLSNKPISQGEFGKVEKLIREALTEEPSLANQYFSELKSIGWFRILDANRINSDQSFSESDIMIEKAKRICKNYKGKGFKQMIDIRSKINLLDVSETIKKDFFAKYDKGMESGKLYLEKHWSLEENSVLEIENILSLLSERKGLWYVDNDQILFNRTEDLELFNSMITKINANIKKQETLRLEGAWGITSIYDQTLEDVENF